MVRGALPLMNLMFLELFQQTWKWNLIKSGIVTGIIVMIIAIIAAFFTEETFRKKMNFVETD
jgi:hypothetical protein